MKIFRFNKKLNLVLPIFMILVISFFFNFANASGDFCKSLFKDNHDVNHLSEYINLEEKYIEVLEMQKNLSPSQEQLLTIVIPAYKEALRLPESIAKMKLFFDQFPFKVKVLIIVEKSPDNTVEVTQAAVGNDLRFEVIDNQVKMGKGYAVRSGMRRATGDFVLFMDADLSTPLPEILNFLTFLNHNPQVAVAIGDRKNVASDIVKDSFLRRAMSSVFNGLVQKVSKTTLLDTQCGFKFFRSNASSKIFNVQSLNGFSFDVEVLMLAQKLGFQVEALPVKWYDDDRTTVNKFLDPIKMAIELLKINSLIEKNLKVSQ